MRKRTIFLFYPLLLMGLVFASSCNKDDDDENGGNNAGSFTDPRDGYVYQIVSIGNQEWLAENLAYVPSSDNYWPYNDNNTNVETYGYLYDWQTALHVCPSGWHLPSDEEWTQLTDYIGGESIAGGKLKATGTIEVGSGLWQDPNTGATNETGFTALPGGLRFDYGNFNKIGVRGYWWSASENFASFAWGRSMHHNSMNVFRDTIIGKELGLSVRCLRN